MLESAEAQAVPPAPAPPLRASGPAKGRLHAQIARLLRFLGDPGGLAPGAGVGRIPGGRARDAEVLPAMLTVRDGLRPREGGGNGAWTRPVEERGRTHVQGDAFRS